MPISTDEHPSKSPRRLSVRVEQSHSGPAAVGGATARHRPGPGKIRFTVEDRGPGIPASDHDVEQKLINLQFTETLRKTPRDQQHVGGEQFLAMFRAGRIPTTSTETSFWQYMFAHATHQGDVALFEELLAHVKKAKAGDARLQRYLSQLEEQLAKLKASKGGK